jgi:signal transduction histidine kinase
VCSSDLKGYRIAIKRIPGSESKLYVLYDVNRFRMDERLVNFTVMLLVAGFVCVAMIGGWLGYILSRRVIAPVTLLADRIKGMDPEKSDFALSGEFSDDEIGFLTKTLEQSMKSTKTMIEREKQFTRDVSHELRTPLTIMKGALELIQENPEHPVHALQKPIGRIERSIEEMRLTIESLLWLARKENVEETYSPCDALSLIREIIDQNLMIFKDKKLNIDLKDDERPMIFVPPPVFRMIMNNILRNAFHFTAEGKISVLVGKDHIKVTDTGTGIDPDVLGAVINPHVRGENSHGFGLGLAIVHRLCERFGLKFVIDSERDQGTTVQIVLS